jgi:hypothetical protein
MLSFLLYRLFAEKTKKVQVKQKVILERHEQKLHSPYNFSCSKTSSFKCNFDPFSNLRDKHKTGRPDHHAILLCTSCKERKKKIHIT